MFPRVLIIGLTLNLMNYDFYGKLGLVAAVAMIDKQHGAS